MLKLTAFILTCFLALGIAGCEEKGPMEKAGEKVDEAVESAGDQIEEAADKVEDATD